MIDISRLMRYTQYLRHAYFDVLRGLPWDEVVRDQGASFGSLRNIFVHCIAVFDFANRLLQDNETTFPRVVYDDYNTMEAIQRYMERVESRFDAYLSTLTPDELSRQVTRTYPSGATMTATVEDYLLHFFQEETHHRGEFIALLWQMDVTPPHVGWLQYIHLEGVTP
jgi:uncharacterized damage-inducible protein DinB